MKKIFTVSCRLFIIVAFILPVHLFSQNVGIGTATPNASAALDVQSTSKGFLLPRMTSLQRDAISNPGTGLMIFNTDTQNLEIFTTVGWGGIKQTKFPIEKLIGGSNDDIGIGVLKTTDGGYIVAAQSSSSNNGDVSATNHGNYDVWIFKLDISGNILWNKLLGGSNNESVNSIQQTTDGGYIVVGTAYSSASGDVTGVNHGQSDAWIVKLDASGNILWNKLLGGTGYEDGKSIQQTIDGGYIVACNSESSASGDITATNHGATDYWIVKLDALGNIVWNKLLGGNGEDLLSSIAQTTDGGYIVAGYSASSANGNVTGTSHGNEDCWIVKLDVSGNIAWNKLFGGSNFDRAKTILQNADGSYVISCMSNSSASGDVTETSHGSTDLWIVKIDGTGNIIWNKLVGGAGNDLPNYMISTADGGVVITSNSPSILINGVFANNHGGDDYLIVKIDATGFMLWSKMMGGNNVDYAMGITRTLDGGYVVVGYTISSANGNITGTSHGSGEIWIVKTDALGNIITQ